MFSGGKKSSIGSLSSGGGRGGLSFIGTDVVVSGDVTGSGQLHIDGRVEGNVRCEMLIQGDGGTIAGHIEAETAHIAGLVDGTVKAKIVTLEPTARVTGDVTYETLSIAAGAEIEGRLSRREAGASAPATAAPVSLPKPDKKAAAKAKDEPGLLAAATAAPQPSAG